MDHYEIRRTFFDNNTPIKQDISIRKSSLYLLYFVPFALSKLRLPCVIQTVPVADPASSATGAK